MYRQFGSTAVPPQRLQAGLASRSSPISTKHLLAKAGLECCPEVRTELCQKLASFIPGQLVMMHFVDRTCPNRARPSRVRFVSRDNLPVQMRHLIPHTLHVNVVRTTHLYEAANGRMYIAAKGQPFLDRQLIRPDNMLRVVDENAMPSISLIFEKAKR
jgi:hypothetical protein